VSVLDQFLEERVEETRKSNAESEVDVGEDEVKREGIGQSRGKPIYCKLDRTKEG
jgi:hypothetical protein